MEKKGFLHPLPGRGAGFRKGFRNRDEYPPGSFKILIGCKLNLGNSLSCATRCK
jgi:hypothetical protein